MNDYFDSPRLTCTCPPSYAPDENAECALHDSPVEYRRKTAGDPPFDIQRANITAMRKTITLLRDQLRFVRQTVHQAHHDGPIAGCTKTTCRAVADALHVTVEP